MQGFLTSSPSDSVQLQLDINKLARERQGELPSSTSWDSCYVEEATIEDLRSWVPEKAATIPDDTPIFLVRRDEDQEYRSKIRKLVIQQTR